MSLDSTPQTPPDAAGVTDPVDTVIRYHLRTKHHFNRYARSLGFLDWANQPNPFRRFEGAPFFRLPLLVADREPCSPAYDAIYRRGAVASQPVAIPALSRFLELALGLSAWKKAGESEWALRCNPSSGNLHPTEGYVVTPRMEAPELTPGLYHYAPKEHGLELRAEFDAATLASLLTPFPPHAFLFGLTSVHWREAWKYGERAFRYCQHDIGHAIGSARIAAATLGWNMVLLDGMEQNTVALVLGTTRAGDFDDVEPEHPDCLALVWPRDPDDGASKEHEPAVIPLGLDPSVVQSLTRARWHGRANRLSREHAVSWTVIDEAVVASWKVTAEPSSLSIWTAAAETVEAVQDRMEGLLAADIIRRRRSAVAFDGKTAVPASTFFHMLRRVMPRAERRPFHRPMPWDSWPYDPAIHLLLFVHRVDGLTPGIYFLARDHRKGSLLQQAMNPELVWATPPGCPDDVPLSWLLEGDARRLAAQVSCHQDIAGDSAFSLGMVAEFESRLREGGAWWYPRLFWESGLIGQVLYLEAEAAGVRATGIGCFFDDPVHEIVAINGLNLQSLYHFTVGGPVDDVRLMTLPAYHHLQQHPSSE